MKYTFIKERKRFVIKSLLISHNTSLVITVRSKRLENVYGMFLYGDKEDISKAWWKQELDFSRKALLK